MPQNHWRSLLLTRWALFAAISSPVFGQMHIHVHVGPAAGNDANAAGDDDKSTPPGVSVPDSPGAVERLEKATDKENQKQWQTAAEFYQEAITKFPARVVPVRLDAKKGIFQYSGVAQIVQERLAKWPADGLKIYNNLYGQTAADLLAATPRGDVGALSNIFWTYFATDAGKTAGIRLMDCYTESGDFQAAAWMGNRLLSLHPNLVGDRGMIIYRTALASHWAGDDTAANTLLAQLKQNNSNDIASIGGKDVRLVDSLTTAVTALPLVPTTRPADADTYPSFGGQGGYGEISSSSAKPGASLKSVQLTQPDYLGLMGPQRAVFLANDQLAMSNNQSMGIIPVVDAGKLFFQDGRSLYAVDEDTGAPLPGWLDTYTGEHAGRYKASAFGRVRNELLTLTASPTAVLAVMGQPDRTAMMSGGFVGQAQGTASTVKLVCLDRETGRELWTRTPSELPESAATLRTAEYSGTPLIIPAALSGHGEAGAPDDSVLVTARGGKENQFDDCYVVCLSLKTGQYRWSTYVGSATRNINMEGFAEGDPSQMSLADGRVFVMSNLGTVAALDPSDGRVIWLNSYVRDNNENPQEMFFRNRRFGQQAAGLSSTNAWAHNPVFVSNGSVFLLPNDSKRLYVYNAANGDEQKRLSTSICDNAEVMLGVRDGTVVLSSAKKVFAFNWQAIDPEDASPSPTDISFSDNASVCGRGFITSDSIFIPTTNRLVQIEWKGKEAGRIMSVYPARGNFSGGQGPGNLLATANNIVVAGQTQVDIYTNLSLVKRRYELAISESPNDAEPRINYAIALFSAGQMNDAIARSDEAINLLGGPQNMRPGKGRSLLFATLLDFAHRAGKGSNSDKSTDANALADQFYDRAGTVAETPVEQATYRLARAKADHDARQYAQEVELCQQILSSDSMRSAVLSDENTAGAAAEAAIATAINPDRAIYSAIEEDAGKALAAARAGNDPDQLLAVATVYPNSKAAIDARQTAVDRYEASNQPEKAIDVLRRIYASTTDNTVKAHLLESIANDFLITPDGLGPALDRLCRASRFFPGGKLSQKIRLPDGTELADMTYAAAITTLRQMQADQDIARLPDFHLTAATRKSGSPFTSGKADVLSNVTALVHPLQDFNRYDQILTWSPAGLAMYAAGQTIPTSTLAAIDKEPLAAAWAHDSWLVWTSGEVFQINKDGKVGWTFSLTSLPDIGVSSGGETVVDDVPGDIANKDDDNNNVRLMNVNGQLVPVGPGQFINQRGRFRINGGVPVPLLPQAADRPAQEEIVAVQPGGSGLVMTTSSGRIVTLNISNGQLLWQVRPVDHAVDQLLVNRHYTVARMDDPSGSLLAVYDTPTGRVIGRRRFGPDNSPAQGQLVNVALSEESTLGITLYNRVLVLDLYDAWKVAPKELGAQANRDAAPFVGLNQSDQLLIKGGRLACLYDSASYARGYDLSKNADPTNPLATHANSSAAYLRMIGPRLYVRTGKGMAQYNLQDSSDHYDGGSGLDYTPKVEDMLEDKHFAILIITPVDRGPAGSPYESLMAYSRALVKGKTRESGVLAVGPYVVKSPVGIMDWIGADGGLYYREKNNTVTFMRGARQDTP